MKAAIVIMSAFVITVLALIMCRQPNTEQQAATLTTEPAKPKTITTVQWLDSAKNLGKVREGEKIEINFRFKNTGAEPLVISNVVVSCGCTVAGKPEKPIMPGEESVIKATFDSKGRSGTNHKTMAVYANTQESVTTLAFDVEVEAKSK